jgi:hypothetical protein
MTDGGRNSMPMGAPGCNKKYRPGASLSARRML